MFLFPSFSHGFPHIDVLGDQWTRSFSPGGYTLTVSKAGFGQRGRLSMVALSGAIAFQGAVPWHPVAAILQVLQEIRW